MRASHTRETFESLLEKVFPIVHVECSVIPATEEYLDDSDNLEELKN
jgi:hypothetical protein